MPFQSTNSTNVPTKITQLAGHKKHRKICRKFCSTENFRNSAVPYCERLLNEDPRRKEDRVRAREQRTTTAGRAPGQIGGRTGPWQGVRDKLDK